MSSRKGTVIWVCTVVILVVLTLSGIGIGASTAADSAEFQVVDAALEEGDDVIDTRDVEAGPNEIKIIESIEPFAAGTHDFSVTNVSIATLIGLDPGSPGQVSDSDEDDEEDEEEDNEEDEDEDEEEDNEEDEDEDEEEDNEEDEDEDEEEDNEEDEEEDNEEDEEEDNEEDEEEDNEEDEEEDNEEDEDETDSDEAELDPPGQQPNPPGQQPNPPGQQPNPPGQQPNPPGQQPNPPGQDLDSDEPDSEETESEEEEDDEEEDEEEEDDEEEDDEEEDDEEEDDEEEDEDEEDEDEEDEDEEEDEETDSEETESDSSTETGSPETETDSSDTETDTTETETNSSSTEPESSPETDSPGTDPDSNGNTNSDGGGGPSGSSGSSGSTDSSGSSRSSGSATAGDEEPTVVRSESNESITVEIDGATGERYDIAVNLAGPSNSDPAVSVTSVAVDPAGDRAAFETTIGRPTAEPSGRDPVPHGVALGHIEFDSTLDADGTSAATLQFDIDEETIPGGLGPENVAVLRYADGAWTTENVGHDVEGDTHTVTLSYATPVAVVALEPGRVEVVESVVPADQVRVGHETALRATVENPGDRPTTRNLTVSMNGESVAEREVALDPGENATVQIRFRPRESGTVSLEGNEVGAITLFDDDDGATSTDAETNEDIPGFGVIVAVLALLVTAFGARVRRS